jgi:hypothetical protein
VPRLSILFYALVVYLNNLVQAKFYPFLSNVMSCPGLQFCSVSPPFHTKVYSRSATFPNISFFKPTCTCT